jgi:hypothetical protein
MGLMPRDGIDRYEQAQDLTGTARTTASDWRQINLEAYGSMTMQSLTAAGSRLFQ